MIGQIEESYVALETAKLLKEKGFDYRCRKYYIDDSMFEHTHGEIIPKNYDIYECPTQQMAMSWLRKIHNIHIVVKNFGYLGYVFTIQKLTSGSEQTSTEFYSTYEKAVEEAIQHCLKCLI